MMRFSLLIILSAALYSGSAFGDHLIFSPIETHATASEFQPNIPWSGRVNAITRHQDNPHIVLVSTPTGGLFRSTNGGNSWQSIASMPAPFTLDVKFHPDRPNVVIATAYRDFKHFSYLPLRLDPFLNELFENVAVAPEPDSDVPVPISNLALNNTLNAPNIFDVFRVHTTGGGIWISTNYGASWFRPPSAVPRLGINFSSNTVCPPKYSAFGISIEPGSGTIFVGTDCGVAISRSYGHTWEHVELDGLNHGEEIVSIAALGNGVVLAGANQGVFWSRDGGTTWTEDQTPSLQIGGRDIHAIGDLPLGGQALLVDSNRNLNYVRINNSGLQSSMVGFVPTSSGACGGISLARGYFGEPGANGSRQNNLYLFYGNRCRPYAAQARVANNTIIFPTSAAGWVELEQNHADFRHILPDLKYVNRTASGGTNQPTVHGFTEPWIADGGKLEDDAEADFPAVVEMIANDGGLDIYNSNNTPFSVGSGQGGINALQLYEVTGQKVGRNRYDIYVGTHDNAIRASINGGASWPGAVGGEGMGINLAREVANEDDSRVTYMSCGPCRTGIADAGLENPQAWPDPFVDEEGDAGYPLLLNESDRVSFGIDDQNTEDGADDTVHFYRTANEGNNWTKISDEIDDQVRDSVQVSTLGPDLPNLVFAVASPRRSMPYYDGNVNSKNYQLAVLPDALQVGSQSIRYPAMNGFGGLGRVPFQFKWAVNYGMDSWDVNHILAADVVNQTMAQTFDLGENWEALDGLKQRVTQNGAYYFSDAYHRRNEHYPLVSAISYFPDDPHLVLIGTRQGGVFVSGDRGSRWVHVQNSERMPNVTSFHWVSENRALASTYGRGLWSISIEREFRFPGFDPGKFGQVLAHCKSANSCSYIGVNGGRAQPVDVINDLDFDNGLWVFDGQISQLTLDDRVIRSLAVSPGASTLNFNTQRAASLAPGDKIPLAKESVGPAQLAGVPDKLQKKMKNRAIIAVIRHKEQVLGFVIAKKPTRLISERKMAPNLAYELGTQSPLEGIPFITVQVLSQGTEQGESNYVLRVRARNLEAGEAYEIVSPGSHTPYRSKATANADGAFSMDIEIEYLGTQEGEVRLYHRSTLLDSELYVLPLDDKPQDFSH